LWGIGQKYLLCLSSYEPERRHANALVITVIVRECRCGGDSKDCRE